MPPALSLAALALALAAAVAYPTKDEEALYYNNLLRDLPEDYRVDPRNLDAIGGGNLLRDLSRLRDRVELTRRAGLPCYNQIDGCTMGNEKRNMDEIDRSSFNSFIKKNFDEIDRSGFGGFVKRNFDEIDRSGFGGFVKKSPSSRHTQN